MTREEVYFSKANLNKITALIKCNSISEASRKFGSDTNNWVYLRKRNLELDAAMKEGVSQRPPDFKSQQIRQRNRSKSRNPIPIKRGEVNLIKTCEHADRADALDKYKKLVHERKLEDMRREIKNLYFV